MCQEPCTVLKTQDEQDQTLSFLSWSLSLEGETCINQHDHSNVKLYIKLYGRCYVGGTDGVIMRR